MVRRAIAVNELELFAAAIAVADPTERAAVLDRECASDPARRARLEALLCAHDNPDSLLDNPAVGPPDAHDTVVSKRVEVAPRVNPHQPSNPTESGAFPDVPGYPVSREIARG